MGIRSLNIMVSCLQFAEAWIDRLIRRDTIVAGSRRTRIVNQVGVRSMKNPQNSGEDKPKFTAGSVRSNPSMQPEFRGHDFQGHKFRAAALGPPICRSSSRALGPTMDSDRFRDNNNALTNRTQEVKVRCCAALPGRL